MRPQIKAPANSMDGLLVGMNEAIRPMQSVKEKKKATEEKQKLVDTCVAHSFLHLYLLIGKNKSNRLLML